MGENPTLDRSRVLYAILHMTSQEKVGMLVEVNVTTEIWEIFYNEKHYFA